MAFDSHANFAVSTVATAPSPATSGTSLVVTAGQGSRFPAVPFNAVVCPNAVPDPTNAEVVRVTARSTDTLTITRAQESSVARTIVVGDRIFAAITSKTLTDVEAAVNAASTTTTGTHAARLAAAHVANRLWKETDTGLIYADDGAAWTIWEGNGRVIKAADETVNNSVTLQNDDHLFFPIEVNEVWYAEALLLCSGASTTADFKFGWTGPTGATSQWGSQALAGSSGYNNTATTTDPGRSLTFADSVALGARAATIILTLGGWFFADATHAGNIQLQWAQNTATVENNTVLKNSLLRLRRIA
jgi:hypothetical protein